ncbi:TDP-4-oxo-6-deoxy-D-glucose aminotransferase [Sphingopyxis sp. Root214]|jgi:dTDP-4-amino-4,6-dideoxygalactose transaminase|uniref:dTDP-4-amino-4,6-dideoxygalactose transaminase n=1 Tax=unclassified Sphingopyxis TaxID=2614943 RepID=UPI0006F6F40B|nr:MULTISPECIES: dTDP-4-amino-4,6-dideoxygalactose transaminase [unclassified Sphingopyxis]KQZ76409.1 TDP-4-oxo-6-deoxy-D-glucose aminotransferase [Sphingopyxis sp. Root154]KRC09703.1 TDP-4-oxo-6-deoxy-D-glucose aminotransferase [Sphingopyxis sp. Root214]
MLTIPFNRPSVGKRELDYIGECLAGGKHSGDGPFTKRCNEAFRTLGLGNILLTTSCTDALEMAAILLGIGPGDEVILPSFTFVSSANAFALRGATLRFADSEIGNPNIAPDAIEALITPRTKAIVVVHYAGVACDMDRIEEIAKRHGIAIVEDAAQAIDSYHRGRPLGTIGAIGTMSFHETKNISAGEGGLIMIRDEALYHRAEIVREKGTNRSAFFRGEVDKYGWVDLGSSFLPSDILAAYLLAQVERLPEIQGRRCAIWNRYDQALSSKLSAYGVRTAVLPEWATNNAHMFYLLFENLQQRQRVIDGLRASGITAASHYISLHSSPFFHQFHDGRPLPNSDRFTDTILRLPMFADLADDDVDLISDRVLELLEK